MNICIIGAGAWGTALALHFSRRHSVTLAAHTPEAAQNLRECRENPLLPGFRLPESLHIADAHHLQAAFDYAQLAIVATPVAALRGTLQKMPAGLPVLAACKGFEQGTGLLPHQVIAQTLPQTPFYGLLTGPSFARELAQNLPCAVCLAANDADWAEKTAAALNDTVMRLYAVTDLTGAGVGGAVKNVMAIASGVADGLHSGMNARAALMTRGLAEIRRLAAALGGKEETLNGLSGMGDLVLTCTGSLSRNRQVGLMLAEDKPLPEILRGLGHVAEGVYTVGEVVRLAEKHGIDMPVTQILHELLQGRIRARAAVGQLMQREPKFE